MWIGEVAKETGVTVDAIRFYERTGLLPNPSRTLGGFRIYGPDQVWLIDFVQRMKTLGFSLPQIRELLAVRQGRRSCGAVRDRLRRKLADVRHKIRELQHLESELLASLRRCEHQLRRRGDRCPLLEVENSPTRERRQ